MSCDGFLAGLQGLVDGEECDPELREHARSCPACAERLEGHTSLRGALRLSAVEEPSVGARFRTLLALARAAAECEVTVRANPPAVMTLPEVALFLRVPEAQVRRMVHQLPHFVAGGELRFRRESLERWIEREERRQAASVFTSPGLALLPDEDAAWPLTG